MVAAVVAGGLAGLLVISLHFVLELEQQQRQGRGRAWEEVWEPVSLGSLEPGTAEAEMA